MLLEEYVELVRNYIKDYEGLNRLLEFKEENETGDLELYIKLGLGQLNFISPYNDENFISYNDFIIYFIDICTTGNISPGVVKRNRGGGITLKRPEPGQEPFCPDTLYLRSPWAPVTGPQRAVRVLLPVVVRAWFRVAHPEECPAADRVAVPPAGCPAGFPGPRHEKDCYFLYTWSVSPDRWIYTSVVATARFREKTRRVCAGLPRSTIRNTTPLIFIPRSLPDIVHSCLCK